ncbi:hypothetical protein BpHYR1_053010 [Brachionus plicatilis]|uniref:Uncharacterized protein n=1 Tax=Brachionus plicatilis TaxID=10195 RepID=A0A3M7S9X9_BRAPC|nr:hypothetical protein BpHYR1_053010 [Brachionus plicatilis]
MKGRKASEDRDLLDEVVIILISTLFRQKQQNTYIICFRRFSKIYVKIIILKKYYLVVFLATSFKSRKLISISYKAKIEEN